MILRAVYNSVHSFIIIIIIITSADETELGITVGARAADESHVIRSTVDRHTSR